MPPSALDRLVWKQFWGNSRLTTGDTIMITHNKKNYNIDVVETKPSPAISTVDTDCEVEFAPPLDYKEPAKPAPVMKSKNAYAKDQEKPAKEEPKFRSFTGVSRRLDGKPSNELASPSFSPVVEEHPLVATEVTSKATKLNFQLFKHSGKLSFRLLRGQLRMSRLKLQRRKKVSSIQGKKYTLAD
ncbi:hypothetical protein L1049_007640 [Liquidambar formosana]|uniref:Ubiquitin fusion degradation protein UFD1 N-terminal subdomain 2 domain-containing protein n=1 Tax=Liquidambar formosana TaxID=63359 RepID=A0AAP0S255_LIQFO